jgi:hypothetical protein
MNRQENARFSLLTARFWGAPIPDDQQTADTYTGRTVSVLSPRLRQAVEHVEETAKWASEATEVLVGLVAQGEAATIRAWNRNMLYEVGYPVRRPLSMEAYADAVMRALEDLADLVDLENGK